MCWQNRLILISLRFDYLYALALKHNSEPLFADAMQLLQYATVACRKGNLSTVALAVMRGIVYRGQITSSCLYDSIKHGIHLI